MEELLRALILGIVQGLTEFLPVSSSGHLELAKWILGGDSLPEESMLMTVTLHAATALATLIVFRREVFDILRDLFKFSWNDGTKFAALIVVSMVPAAIVGVLFDEALEALFDQQIVLVALMLILTGGLLFLADRAKETNKDVSWASAAIIGVAQAIAILPGISRSGATISTSVLLGIDRERAAKFSFLMVVPLIFGKMAKDLLDGDFSGAVPYAELGVGFAAAFVTGILACVWMIRLVKKAELKWFAYYCFAVAVVVLGVRFLG